MYAITQVPPCRFWCPAVALQTPLRPQVLLAAVLAACFYVIMSQTNEQALLSASARLMLKQQHAANYRIAYYVQQMGRANDLVNEWEASKGALGFNVTELWNMDSWPPPDILAMLMILVSSLPTARLMTQSHLLVSRTTRARNSSTSMSTSLQLHWHVLLQGYNTWLDSYALFNQQGDAIAIERSPSNRKSFLFVSYDAASGNCYTATITSTTDSCFGSGSWGRTSKFLAWSCSKADMKLLPWADDLTGALQTHFISRAGFGTDLAASQFFPSSGLRGLGILDTQVLAQGVLDRYPWNEAGAFQLFCALFCCFFFFLD